MAFRLSTRMGLCPGQDTIRAEAHLRAAGLRTRLSDVPDIDWNAEDLAGRMATATVLASGWGPRDIARLTIVYQPIEHR